MTSNRQDPPTSDPDQAQGRQIEKLLRLNNELIQALSGANIGAELLEQAIDALAKLTQARYGAIALLEEGEIQRFTTFGIDKKTQALIGDLPQTGGLLGLSLKSRQPLRIDNMAEHPAFEGFPDNHPPMRSLLAVPICCAEQVCGQIYLSEKTGGQPFNELDEQMVCSFASSLALIIKNLRHKELQAKASNQINLYSKVFKNSAEAIMITDQRGKLLSVNEAFCRITGFCETEVINKTPRFLRANRHSRGFYKRLLSTLKNCGYWHGELWDKRKDGETYPAGVSISAITHNGDALPSNYIILLSDSSERQRYQERIQYLAYYDTITDLPNRVLFQDRVQQLLSITSRAKQAFAVLVVDIDHFKNINDSLGHSNGDRLLKLLAMRLSEVVRKGDSLARLSGDEFAITLGNLKRPEAAAISAKKILQALQRPFMLDKQEIYITASIGISVFPNDGDDAATLIKHAEAAMFYTKSQQRNAYQYYHSEINANTSKKLAMETSLRHALERQQFTLHYQPMVELDNWQISSAEALIRWHHPQLGIIMPDVFIPQLEESGLITQIGEWVLRQACKDISLWLDNGLSPPKVSINLSPRQFDQEESINNIFAILDEYKHCLPHISVEITETTLMKNAERANRTLERLKAMGIQIAVDDFGTGYSSLAYLSNFPLDTLKIDRSFINAITTCDNKATITRSVIDLAHNLGLKALAEGVETREQLHFLNELGCNACQGYLFSRPIDSRAFADLIEQQDTITPLAC